MELAARRMWGVAHAAETQSLGSPRAGGILAGGVAATCAAIKRPVPGDLSPRIAALDGPAALAKLLAPLRPAEVEPRDFANLLLDLTAETVPYGASYLSPEDTGVADQLAANRYVGIGIRSHYDDSKRLLEVADVLGDGPAYRAGMVVGDAILKIDGRDVQGLRMDAVLAQLRGAVKSRVLVEVVRRDGERQELKIVRDLIPLPSVVGRNPRDNTDFWLDRDAGLAYAQFSGVRSSTLSELRDLERNLRKQNVRGLVLDLRGFYGATLEQTALVGDAFLDGGPLWTLRRPNGARFTIEADRDALFRGVPLVVIVESSPESTASPASTAAALLAAAWQDAGRAGVLGNRIHCDGLSRRTIELPDDAGRLTVPDGYVERGRGAAAANDQGPDWSVRPDFLVERRKTRRDERAAPGSLTPAIDAGPSEDPYLVQAAAALRKPPAAAGVKP